MIESVVKVALPVAESLHIKRNRFNGEVGGKRVAIVTGSHGDELEGQYLCFRLAQEIETLKIKGKLKGTVDIYPALNPLGVDSITRNIPPFDVDMNRTFPGTESGTLPELVAKEVLDSLAGADLVIDIHSSNIFLREIPQVRMDEENSKKLIPLAKEINVDFLWVYPAITVLNSTLAHSLNSIGTKTLVVEMGVGMRITEQYGEQLLEGILNVLSKLEVIECGREFDIRTPLISYGEEVHFINSTHSGVFIPKIKHWIGIKKGDLLGYVVDVLGGEILHAVVSPCDGVVFTLREYPIVYEGSLLARIYENRSCERGQV